MIQDTDRRVHIYRRCGDSGQNEAERTNAFISHVSQNIQINLLLQSTAKKHSKELQITIIIHFESKRDKIRID